MPPPRTSSDDHEQFHRLCAQLDEFEPLPSVTEFSSDTELPPGEQLERAEDEQTALDGLILAGLVAPY